MNDEFLHALRRPPSGEFAHKLKRQLQQQDALRAKRFSTVRTLLTLFLLGGSAVAGGYLATNSRSREGGDAPTKSAVVAEEHSSARGLQTNMPALAMAPVDAAVSVDDGNSAHRQDFATAASPSATSNSAQSDGLQAHQAIRGGSITSMGGGSKENTAQRVDVVTSSLAYPLAKAVLDTFSLGSLVKPPIDIRTEEAAAAFRILCSSSVELAFDVVVASRRITEAELEDCRRAGVRDVVEFKIGYQALVLISGTTSAPIKLSPRLMYLALAEQVPDPAQPGHWIDNPYRSWDQIDSTLDSRAIQVLGPARGTRLRKMFEILALGPGCDAHDCYSVRTDGLYQEVEQTNTMVSQHLLADPHAVAVVDYNFYERQRSLLTVSPLGGIEPTDLTLADGTYPLSRPVYVYTNSKRARFDRTSVGARFFWAFVERGSESGGYLYRSGLTLVGEQELKAQYERQQIPRRGASTGP